MLNSVNIQGRLTSDPELRRTQNGIAVTSFTVAVDGDTKESSTAFVNCVAWRKTAEFVEKYFCKGKMIIVCGRLQTRSYKAQDGSKRFVTEVVADQVHFAGDSQKQRDEASSDVATSCFSQVAVDDEELPF